MKVAVLGAGSLGTFVGAMLTKAGIDTVLVDGYAEHVDALNQTGATIIGTMEMNIPVKACSLDNITGLLDIVVYMAKSTNNSMYLPAIAGHLRDNSVVCTLQNGVPEEAVSKYVGKDRVIGGVVSWGASLKGPGVTELTSDPDKLTYEIGELDSSISTRLQAVKTVLDCAGTCTLTDNLKAIRWTKLAINAAFSGMSAALGCNYGDVLHNDRALMCAAFIKDELIKVAHAQSIKLLEIQGVEFKEFELINGVEDFDRVKPLYYKWYTPHVKVIASMLFDMRLGKKTEIDSINGEVADRGDLFSIDTPFNDLVIKLVKKAEHNGLVNTLSNLDAFEHLLNVKKGEIAI